MARNDQAPRTLPAKDSGAITEVYTAADYSQNMFEDGNNRTETNKKAHDAPAYDRAAHTISPDTKNPFEKEELSNVIDMTPILRSRDGTEASGSLDEDGGSLGGTEDELDSLEAGGTPVDRNPRMKD